MLGLHAVAVEQSVDAYCCDSFKTSSNVRVVRLNIVYFLLLVFSFVVSRLLRDLSSGLCCFCS